MCIIFVKHSWIIFEAGKIDIEWEARKNNRHIGKVRISLAFLTLGDPCQKVQDWSLGNTCEIEIFSKYSSGN